jgi:hypothetical protein
MKCKSRACLFGVAREGGFTLDVFLRLFFDAFLANTKLQTQGKLLKNHQKKTQKSLKNHQKAAT